MDCDSDLLKNHYWTLLQMEWDSNLIDLDETETLASSKTCSAIKHSNFHKGSLMSVCESPFGINMFKKTMNYTKCVDKNIYYSSGNWKKYYYLQRVDDCGNYSKMNFFEYESLKGSTEKIENIYESLEEHQLKSKKSIVDVSVVEHSVSISGLSFDDTVVSCENENSLLNQTGSTIKKVISENALLNSESNDHEKIFWKNISESVPPPDALSPECNISMKSASVNTSYNNTLTLNNAIVETNFDSTLNNSADSISDYYAFALGAIHKSNSDYPTKNVDKVKEGSLPFTSISLFSTKTSTSFNIWSKNFQEKNNRKDSMNLFPPENDLQKNSADRVLSEHQLRVQRSLQKLNLPDWYKNSPARPEGFLLKKRASDAGASNRGWESSGLGSKTTSLGSLGGGVPLARSPLALTPPSQQLAFSRWSTSRLNSAQTSPCSSARSSLRGGAVSPLTSPARPPRVPRPTRAPYLGWRSQERLASPRTPHERLAVSLLPQSPPVPANVSDEIQSSIKEVTSAIVHYVSGLEPTQDRLNVDSDVRSTSPRGSPRLCWLESSFVGTKPLESPQTPVVVALSPPHQSQPQQRPLQLDLPSSRPSANGTVTLSTTTYQHDWQSSQHSLLNLAITKPSPGSTTLEDVLDSLLGLPPAVPRIASPQNSPRRAPSPYYMLGLQTRYKEQNNSQTSSLQLNLSNKIDDKSSSEYHTPLHNSEDTYNSIEISQDGDILNRRRSSAESSSCSTLAPGGADKDSNSITSLPKIRARAKSALSGKHSSRRQSEPATAQKSHSLDRRISYDSRISKGENTLSKTSLSDTPQSRTSLKSITSINTDGSGEDTLVHCRYTKCTSATTQADARRYYKNCHNCNYLYCSRECRRAHWEKHRKVCLHSRASTLCRQILSTAKEDNDSLHHISMIAQRGYLSQGRGVVKVFFTSPDAAEKFTANGFQSLGEPIYVKWPDLMPNEMGPELYAELIKLCKSYNPETRLVLYVAVCIVSEVPTKGAAVKWERQIVSRCAKLRLSNTVTSSSHSQMPTYSSPKAKVRNKDRLYKDKETLNKTASTETLILTSNSANFHQKSNTTVQKIREISFNNIQLQLQKRGVNLKKHYPEVHTKLCSYVEGACDKFTPITIYPRDNTTGKLFMCVIMPETEPDKFQTLPNDNVECQTIDVSIDHSDQLSTPM